MELSVFSGCLTFFRPGGTVILAHAEFGSACLAFETIFCHCSLATATVPVVPVFWERHPKSSALGASSEGLLHPKAVVGSWRTVLPES